MKFDGISSVGAFDSDFKVKMKEENPQKVGTNNFVTGLINNIGNFLNGSMAVEGNNSSASGAFNS